MIFDSHSVFEGWGGIRLPFLLDAMQCFTPKLTHFATLALL
jgi:hypothetical protein